MPVLFTAVALIEPLTEFQHGRFVVLKVSPGVEITLVMVEVPLHGPLTVRVTVYVPAEEKVCVGFWTPVPLLVPDIGSPKFQTKLFGQGVELLVN